MERERINQKPASRIIQQKQCQGTNTIVDNRPYSSLSFLSNPTAQRVSEEDEETMQGKFDSSIQRMEDEDEETLQGKFESPVQRVNDEDEDSIQGKFDKPIQKKNETGMPDNLKAGIESLSGFSMDDVRVHYNSSKPATVQALAYTQGTDIHVAPGQEKHLPHEAWHVAQQMAGRVSPTTNINGMPVNDNAGLEHEADVMGERAIQCKEIATKHVVSIEKPNCSPLQLLTGAQKNKIKKYVLEERFIREHIDLGASQANIHDTFEKRHVPAQSTITAAVDRNGAVKKMNINQMKESIESKALSSIKNDNDGDKAKSYKYHGDPQISLRIGNIIVKSSNGDGKMGTKDNCYIAGNVEGETAYGYHFDNNFQTKVDSPDAW